LLILVGSDGARRKSRWLKSSIAPDSEWYDWDGGSLFVKHLDGSPALVQEPVEGEPDAEFSTGQGESGPWAG